MLFKFTTPDILNSALIDVATNRLAYDIITITLPSNSAVDLDSTTDDLSKPKEFRYTSITDSSGSVVASIVWNGRHPKITILDEKVGGLIDLFGSTTVRFMPKILAIPTRFDTEYVWTATPDSLTLFDYDSETTKGKFRQNVIRLPKALSLKSTSRIPIPSESISSTLCLPQSNPSLSSTTSFSSLPSSTLSSPSSSNHLPRPRHPGNPKSSFIPTHLPGLGGNYLEFCQHPLAHDVEIIVSFLMMEILRRGRFLLTPYTFGKPKMWQLKETRDLVLRRLRRHTI